MNTMRHHCLRSWKARLTVAVLGGFLLAITFLKIAADREHVPISPIQVRPAVLAGASAQAQGARLPWYLRSGQWRADVRSLAALLQYLSEPQSFAQTNVTPAKAEAEAIDRRPRPLVFPLASTAAREPADQFG